CTDRRYESRRLLAGGNAPRGRAPDRAAAAPGTPGRLGRGPGCCRGRVGQIGVGDFSYAGCHFSSTDNTQTRAVPSSTPVTAHLPSFDHATLARPLWPRKRPSLTPISRSPKESLPLLLPNSARLSSGGSGAQSTPAADPWLRRTSLPVCVSQTTITVVVSQASAWRLSDRGAARRSI